MLVVSHAHVKEKRDYTLSVINMLFVYSTGFVSCDNVRGHHDIFYNAF